MPVIETSLHVSYQADTWGLREAVREIISNAIDGEARHRGTNYGGMDVTYNEERQALMVSNLGVLVPSKALLMGTSDSRAFSECIGTFGEGLPMALLVLARLNVPVTIYNGIERWEPCIERSERFEGEPVLVIKTRRMRKERGAFIVEIGNISREDFASFQKMFLRLDASFKGEEVVQPSPFRPERVLLQGQFRGRVYNKGVFVLSREDLIFGYDLDVQLNRDRQAISDYELQSHLGTLLRSAADAQPGVFVQTLIYELLAGSSLEGEDAYSSLVYSESFCKAMEEWWKGAYGETIPVENSDEENELTRYGKKGRVVQPLIHRSLKRRNFPTLLEVRKDFSGSVVQTYTKDEISLEDLEVLQQVERVLQKLEGPRLTIVDFASESERGLLCPERGLLLSRTALEFGFKPAVLAAIRAVAVSQVSSDYLVEGRIITLLLDVIQ